MSQRFAPLVRRVAHPGVSPWELHWRARHAAAAGEDVIVLSVGDPDLDTDQAITDTAVEQLRRGDTHYTESSGRPPVRAAIAARHVARTGQNVTADNVIVLLGAQNGLFFASMLLAHEGDEVIAIDPMYATYPATIQVSGAKLIRVAAPAARNFHLDLDALHAAVTARTRAIFVTTPSNPTGIILSQAEVTALAELARRHNLWIVSDEVYAGLASNGRVPSLGALLPEQVLTVSSLSKTHAMPGWRAGWIVGPRDFIQHADELAQCMLYGLPGFIQQAMLTALDRAEQIEAQTRAYCQVRRDLFYAQLSTIAGIKPICPDAGMFMLIDVRPTGLSATDFVTRLYATEGVALLDGAVFGEQTRGFARACFAVEEPMLHEAARRIRRFCASLAAVRKG